MSGCHLACENIGQLVDLFCGLIAHLQWVMILSKQRGTFNRLPPYFQSKMIIHGLYACIVYTRKILYRILSFWIFMVVKVADIKLGFLVLSFLFFRVWISLFQCLLIHCLIWNIHICSSFNYFQIVSLEKFFILLKILATAFMWKLLHVCSQHHYYLHRHLNQSYLLWPLYRCIYSLQELLHLYIHWAM
jgi:hypothetical protein